MEGGSERMAAGVTRLKAAAAGGKGRFLLATFQVAMMCCHVIMRPSMMRSRAWWLSCA
jgi:hypothetical protein